MKKIITVDGPAGSGKERISKYIAKTYNFLHIDSGLLYRELADVLEKNKIKAAEKQKIKLFIKSLKKLTAKKNASLRREKIAKYASIIAKYQFVRNFVNLQQRLITKNVTKKKGFVIDGRDIGSVVFKKAFLKLYIDVDVNIRAKRRYKQLIDNGEKSIYPQILEDIKLRDKQDKNRNNSPLVIPKGPTIIDYSKIFTNTISQIKCAIERIN